MFLTQWQDDGTYRFDQGGWREATKTKMQTVRSCTPPASSEERVLSWARTYMHAVLTKLIFRSMGNFTSLFIVEESYCMCLLACSIPLQHLHFIFRFVFVIV